MNKKFVAVAIAGLLAAPLAQAQTANVTLYGRLNMDLEVVKGNQLDANQPATCTPTSNATNTCNTINPNQFRVSSNSSRFGIRGTESLGGGLNAIFQVESTVSADNATGAGTSIGTRDTFLGLQGSWGTVRMGFYHLPYDTIGGIWGSVPTLETGILASGSIWAQGFTGKATGGFDSRIGNSVRWDSPIMAGWQGQVSYSIGGPNEGSPATNSAVSSGLLMYNNGPIVFGAGLQYNHQQRARGLNDLAWSVAGSYQFPKVKVGLVYEKLDYDFSTTTDLTRHFYGVGVTVDVGPGQLYFDYSKGDEGKGSAPNGSRIGGLAKGDNSSSQQWEVSYTYPLSRRTSVYAGYTQIANESNASYNFAVNPYPVAIGGKPQGVVLGMWHNF